MVKDLSAALASEAVSGHEIVRMKVLGNLFNNLPRESSSRFDAYINLLSLAGRAGRISAVTGQFDKIENWISEWQISQEQVRVLYRKIHSILFAAGKGRQSSIYLVKLLETYVSVCLCLACARVCGHVWAHMFLARALSLSLSFLFAGRPPSVFPYLFLRAGRRLKLPWFCDSEDAAYKVQTFGILTCPALIIDRCAVHDVFIVCS